MKILERIKALLPEPAIDIKAIKIEPGCQYVFIFNVDAVPAYAIERFDLGGPNSLKLKAKGDINNAFAAYRIIEAIKED